MSIYAIHSSRWLLILIVVLFGQCKDRTPDAARFHEFTPILTQETLDEWEGDSEYWQFEDGVLVGEITPENILIENTFYIWNGGTVGDFELKAEYRISAKGNSGINYRSSPVEDREHVLRGYQADIDGENRYTGQVYEERGRSILAAPGQYTHVGSDNTITEIGTLGEASELSTAIDTEGNGWNELQLTVRGSTLIHMINGRVISITVDEGKQPEEGLLGLQLHRGPPMKIEFRNILLKHLPD